MFRGYTNFWKNFKNPLIFKKFVDHSKSNFVAYTLFLIGIFICLKSIEFGRHSFGDLLDGKFNNFTLEHLYRFYIGLDKSFSDGDFFYPLPNIFALSDNHFLIGIIYVFLRIVGLDSASAYNLWIMIGFIANFSVCYYVLMKFGFSKTTSAFGAFIFTFNQIILAKLSHIQLNFRIFIPLALLYAKLYFETRNFKYITFIILCISLQLASNSYNGSYLFLYILVIFLFFLSQFKKSDAHKFLPKFNDSKSAILALLISLIILSCYAIPYLNSKKIYELHIPSTINKNFEFIDLFVIYAPLWNAITQYFKLTFLENYFENHLFLGIGPLLAITYFLVNHRSHKTLKNFDKIIIKSTIFMIVFFWADKYLHNYYFLQLTLPNFTNLRAFTRFYYVVFFGIIYLICLSLDHLKNKTLFHQLFYCAIVIIAIIESFYAPISNENFRDEEKNGLKKYKTLIIDNRHTESATLFLTSSEKYQSMVLNQMLAIEASRDLGLKTLNGYSSRLVLGLDLAKSCNEIDSILQSKEKVVNHFLTRQTIIDNNKKGIKTPENFSTNFKYDRKKILIFLDDKLCE